jgi:glycosyltransferase involved in cell wall biosynthesis
VCGRRFEAFPAASLYNRIIDREWATPIGRAAACGGDAMMTIEPLRSVGSFRADLRAGEEPELCSRLAAQGWETWRIDAPMTEHDAGIDRFGRWWDRAERGGFGYAQVWSATRDVPERLYGRQIASALFWTLALPIAAIVVAAAARNWWLLALVPAAYATQILRIARRRDDFARADRLKVAVTTMVVKAAETKGVLRYWLRLGGVKTSYKTLPIRHETGQAYAMRVAYLVSQYPATSHTFIRREVSALRAAGQSVDTFSIRPPAKAELIAEEDRREAQDTFTLLARPLSDFASAHLRGLFTSPVAYGKTLALALRHRPPGFKSAILAIAHFGESILLAAELKRRRIDHLHNHFANSGATVGFLASRHANIPWSLTIHGISEFDYPAGLTLPQKVSAARFVACVSFFGRAQAMRLVDPALWPRLHIVRCGIEPERLPPASAKSDDKVRLIFVGRLSPEKGIAGLFEALASTTSRADIHLTLVGDGPLRADLEEMVTRLELSAQVTFLGRLPEQQTLVEIANKDVLVLPSFMEGLPIVLMEALALGLPVIASRVAGIPDLVRDGETGLLFDPSNWTSLADAIDRLARDPALRRRLGENGPRRVAEEFSVRASAARITDLLAAAAPSAAIRPAPLAAPNQDTSAPSTGRTGAA